MLAQHLLCNRATARLTRFYKKGAQPVAVKAISHKFAKDLFETFFVVACAELDASEQNSKLGAKASLYEGGGLRLPATQGGGRPVCGNPI